MSSDEGEQQQHELPGRKGGLQGGPARAASLTAERRSEIARRAARARWDNDLGEPRAVKQYNNGSGISTTDVALLDGDV